MEMLNPPDFGADKSSYCGPFFEDGFACYVNIVRLLSKKWRIIISTAEGQLTYLNAEFDQDIDAWYHFLDLVNEVGMASIATGDQNVRLVSDRIQQVQKGT